MKLLSYDEVRNKGIRYHRVHLWKLEKAGEFPKRVPIGRGRHGWVETEIDDWIIDRIKARDNAEAA